MDEDAAYKKSIKDDFADEDDTDEDSDPIVTPAAITALKTDVLAHAKRAGNATSREWKESIARGEEGEILAPDNPLSRRIMAGFKILQMNMSDADTGEILWKIDEWGKERFTEETDAKIPKSILDLRAVAREIKFTSKEKLTDFRLVQRIFLHAACIEEWDFKFGFVIPDSTNTWQQVIQAADKTLPADILSGNVTLETAFYDSDLLVCKSVLRLYYV